MNLWTVVRFVFGNAAAIRDVARNRAALGVGVALVLLTGIARNYDQTFFMESPMWLIGPFIFSFFSGSFLYGVLILGMARRHFSEECRTQKQWATFMTLFWMTAPVAWLYAIPVEHFLDPYRAAEANIALLGIVSLWRVLLMSRIISVLCNVHFLRTLGWVFVAAALEVIIVLFFGAFFGGSFSRHILAAMSGMRNAPEENLISSVLGFVWTWSWAVLLVCVLLLAMRPFRGKIDPLPKLLPGKVPWLSVGMLLCIWALVSVGPQKEQHRFLTHATLVHSGAYSDAMAYLRKHRHSDFPPSRRLEPNPYEYRVWQDLPPTVALLKPDTAPWIRHIYLNHVTAMMSHHYPQYDSLTNVAAMFSAIEQLPEGKVWFQTNQVALAGQGIALRHTSSDTPGNAETIAMTNILTMLSRMGVAITNLHQLTQ